MPWVHRDDATVCHMDSCIRQDHKAVDDETVVLIESAKHLNTPPQYAQVIREQVVVPAQPRWRHNDGSLCPDWESCDTYEHTSADGNETIQKIKAKPFNHEGPADMDNVLNDQFCVACPHLWTSHAASSSDTGCRLCACTRYHDQLGQRDGNVGELIDGRVDVYGDPIKVFPRHAQIWSGILGIEVQPWQVALCMMGYKLGRTAITPDYSDNVDDIDGYEDIFRTLIGDEMIQARDTKAYIAGGGKGART